MNGGAWYSEVCCSSRLKILVYDNPGSYINCAWWQLGVLKDGPVFFSFASWLYNFPSSCFLLRFLACSFFFPVPLYFSHFVSVFFHTVIVLPFVFCCPDSLLDLITCVNFLMQFLPQYLFSIFCVSSLSLLYFLLLAFFDFFCLIICFVFCLSFLLSLYLFLLHMFSGYDIATVVLT